MKEERLNVMSISNINNNITTKFDYKNFIIIFVANQADKKFLL